MALSLGELIAMAQAREDMKDAADRWQKGVNDTSYGIGSILGYIYGGRALGGLSNAGAGLQGAGNGTEAGLQGGYVG